MHNSSSQTKFWDDEEIFSLDVMVSVVSLLLFFPFSSLKLLEKIAPIEITLETER